MNMEHIDVILVNTSFTLHVLGEIIEVKDNVPFDFTTPKTIGCDIKKCPNEGYDHNYCVNSPGDINQLQVRYYAFNTD